MTPIGGRKLTRRRMLKKSFAADYANGDFAPATIALVMRSLGYWKSDGPRRPLWRAK